MKIFNIVFIVLFIVAAALQYNDPDPYLWIPLYLFGAYLCYLAIKKQYNPVLFLTGLFVYSVYAIYLFLDKTGVLAWITKHKAENIAASMQASKPWIEETREFFGLVILIVVLLINMAWLKKQSRQASA
jgi:hypothetical protein